MKIPSWLFDKGVTTDTTYELLGQQTVQVTEEVIDTLTKLAQATEKQSGMQVLDAAPDVYAGPVNRDAALALTYEAAATWLWGQLWGGPDRDALLDVMAN